MLYVYFVWMCVFTEKVGLCAVVCVWKRKKGDECAHVPGQMYLYFRGRMLKDGEEMGRDGRRTEKYYKVKQSTCTR